MYTGNCAIIWSVNLYQIGSGSPVPDLVLEEFSEGHGGIDEDEQSVSSIDGRTVKEDLSESIRNGSTMDKINLMFDPLDRR